jgi:hypothetical protein
MKISCLPECGLYIICLILVPRFVWISFSVVFLEDFIKREEERSTESLAAVPSVIVVFKRRFLFAI